jgi:hypothetical protein
MTAKPAGYFLTRRNRKQEHAVDVIGDDEPVPHGLNIFWSERKLTCQEYGSADN